MGPQGAIFWILGVIVALGIGFWVGYALKNRIVGTKVAALEEEAERKLSEARTRAIESELEAKIRRSN
jgi:uncharacterized protein HemX